MNQITSSDLSKLPHTSQVRFALFCAESVTHLVKPEHKQICDAALDTARAWLDGLATAEECKAAAYASAHAAHAADATYAAYAAAHAAAHAANAAYAAAHTSVNAANAANAAYAAHAAAYAVAEDKQASLIRAQWAYYGELLAFETIIEDIVLI